MAAIPKPSATYDDFQRLHIVAGRVVDVEPFERARQPSYKVMIDLGPDLGRRWSSLQARTAYTEEQMRGRLVVAVVNLPPKNIAGFMSEVLILGVPAEDGSLSLLEPSRGAKIGAEVY